MLLHVMVIIISLARQGKTKERRGKDQRIMTEMTDRQEETDDTPKKAELRRKICSQKEQTMLKIEREKRNY